MNKAELIEAISAETNLSKKDVDADYTKSTRGQNIFFPLITDTYFKGNYISDDQLINKLKKHRLMYIEIINLLT